MSDKTDPRLDVLARERRATISPLSDWQLLVSLDAAARTVGIVRVDTNDEVLVERLARMRFEDWYGSQFGDAPHENARIPHGFTAEARWYLAALREAA